LLDGLLQIDTEPTAEVREANEHVGNLACRAFGLPVRADMIGNASAKRLQELTQLGVNQRDACPEVRRRVVPSLVDGQAMSQVTPVIQRSDRIPAVAECL